MEIGKNVTLMNSQPIDETKTVWEGKKIERNRWNIRIIHFSKYAGIVLFIRANCSSSG
jgi:hypothetical protein